MSDPEDSSPNTVLQAMRAVMQDVGHIGKDRRNEQQGFNFRGIDEVMNALHAPMVKHGLIVTFRLLERERETRTTAKGGTMNVVHLLVEYTFHGPGGDTLVTWAPGEAQDSGDKATNKALSAAFKYALMHGFMIPTQDEEADATHVAATPPARQNTRPTPAKPPAPATEALRGNGGAVGHTKQQRSAIESTAEQLGWTPAQLNQHLKGAGFTAWSQISQQDAASILADLQARLAELAPI